MQNDTFTSLILLRHNLSYNETSYIKSPMYFFAHFHANFFTFSVGKYLSIHILYFLFCIPQDFSSISFQILDFTLSLQVSVGTALIKLQYAEPIPGLSLTSICADLNQGNRHAPVGLSKNLQGCQCRFYTLLTTCQSTEQ